MDTAFRLLLTNAASAALIAAIALVVSRVVRRPGLAHALWLLALVKLVTPPLVPLPVLPSWKIGYALATTPPSPTFVRMGKGTPLPLDSASVAPERGLGAAALARTDTRVSGVRALAEAPVVAPNAPDALAAPARDANRARLGRLAAAVLGMGALAVLVLAAVRFARFRRVLAWAEHAPAATVARAAQLAAQLRLRHAPPVLVVDARIPPMLWPEPDGPRLLLPRGLLRELEPAELDALLAHELAHVRRRDHWVRLVELAATALFWWYPLTWWARAALRRAEERCCDEWVLRVLPRSAEAYANGLLKSLSFVSAAPARVPALASGASPLYELELRLKEILMSRPAPRLAPPLRLALLAVAAAGLAVYPIHARQDEPRAAVPAAEAPAPTPGTPARVKAPAHVAAPARVATPGVPATAPRTPAPARVPAPARLAFTPQAPLPAVAGAPARAPRQPREGQGALDEQRAALDAKRRSLQQQELELSRMELELNARDEQAQLRATAASLREEGKTRQAELCEKQLEISAKQMELQRRQLELDSERLAVDMKRDAQQAGLDVRAEQELQKKHALMDAQAQALEEEMQRLAVEQEIHAVTEATDQMAESLAEQADALKAALRTTGARPDVERELERLEAALAALKATPRSPGASAGKTPAPAPQP